MLQQQTGSLIAEGDLNAATAQQQALDTLAAQIRAEQPDPAVLQALELRIGQLQQQLDQLPLLAEALAQAARLLAELSAQLYRWQRRQKKLIKVLKTGKNTGSKSVAVPEPCYHSNFPTVIRP